MLCAAQPPCLCGEPSISPTLILQEKSERILEHIARGSFLPASFPFLLFPTLLCPGDRR